MSETLWTIRSCLEWTEQHLKHRNEANPRLSAQWLLVHATGLERVELYMHFDQPLTIEERNALREAIQRRLSGEPLQYISGRTSFRYIELAVRPGVFIPRPETEMLVELVSRMLGDIKPIRLLDVGCGSGAIVLALLHELPEVSAVATDISSEAVALTVENARSMGETILERLRVVQDDLATTLLDDSELSGHFDVIVSNPPYIPSEELTGLPKEVVDFEPRLALDGGTDGLGLFRRLLGQAKKLLKPNGLLAVELYETKLESAANLSFVEGFQDVSIHTDLTGRPRFLTARSADGE